MTHLLRMGVGHLSQKNGVLHLVAGEETGEAGDRSFTAGPIYVPLNLTSPALARREGFLLRRCQAQSILTGLFQDSWISRKILTRDRTMGTAIGRKSGM